MMFRYLTGAILFFLISGHSFVYAESPAPPAPMGLSWGMTVDQLKKAEPSAQLTKIASGDLGRRFLTFGLSKTPHDAESVILEIGNSGLLDVTIFFNINKKDPYGNEVRSRFDEISAILNKKYGKLRRTDLTSRGMGGRNWTFYLNAGNNILREDYNKGGLGIVLAVSAPTYYDTRLILAYQDLTRIKAAKKASEKDSF